MSVVFLFGAGASACSGTCYPKAPPLGPALFDELAQHGSVAASVSGELARLFRLDFEAGMAEFREQREQDTTAFLREMADYFARFNLGGDNAYCRLIEVVRSCRRSVVLGSLNYELLLEIAISRTGMKVSYSPERPAHNELQVYKLHGSCNFLPALHPRQITGGSIMMVGEKLGSIVEAPVRVVDAPQVIEFCAKADVLAPVISLYAKGKRVLICPDFVKMQQDAWALEVRNASRLVVIGVRTMPEDSHVWEPLRRSGAPLYYVGPDFDSIQSWANSVNRRRVVWLDQDFGQSIAKLPRLLSSV